MASKLNNKGMELIRENNGLASTVADILGIRITSLPQMLTPQRQSRRLTEYPVLKAISDFSGIPVENLIEDCNADDGVSEELVSDAKV